MQVYEKLGMFYLGRHFDSDSDQLTDTPLLYDASDLVTHAVCVGMTGSGKTGLCISLLEEAAIDNIPAIVIDPKGDLSNLMLTFPDLDGKSFLPWINRAEAEKDGMSAEAFAEGQAALWKKGLAQWDQNGDRIRRYRESVDISIYTPGSSAGLPVSILSSFAAPSPGQLEDFDLLRERIQTTASGILELLGIRADPLQSREHILLSTIIENLWLKGEDVELGQLIQLIQSPPVQRIGVFDIESFYPAPDRLKLAMTLNNLLAAPAFKSWLEGEALDIQKMLYTEEGKARISIFSIAHLSDAERMFFVTLLLNQTLGWMRQQSGTTSLRALLYMDEVFGFFPPVGEPPSKRPLLTLLKQARAFGLGVIMATQNPIDLDYKGLSNAGTWFIGRLQTERDIDRLIDGLTSSSGSAALDGKSLRSIIAGLKKRVFVLHNVHERGGPQLFHTRWVLSYLRGPMTRDQIKALMKDYKKGRTKKSPAARPQVRTTEAIPATEKPVIPAFLPEYYAPVPAGHHLEDLQYRPFLIGSGEVNIYSRTHRVSHDSQFAFSIALKPDSRNPRWIDSQPMNVDHRIFSGDREEEIAHVDFVTPTAKKIAALDKGFESHVYREHRLKLYRNKTYKLTSRPGESPGEFRLRLAGAMREKRDLEKERLRRKFASKIASLDKQIATARRRLDVEEDQYGQKKLEAAISIGSTLLGTIFGNSRARTGITRGARSASKLSKEKQDIRRATEKLQDLQQRMNDLEIDLENQLQDIAGKYDVSLAETEPVALRPKKSDIVQRHFGVLWIPFEAADSELDSSLYPELWAMGDSN